MSHPPLRRKTGEEKFGLIRFAKTGRESQNPHSLKNRRVRHPPKQVKNKCTDSAAVIGAPPAEDFAAGAVPIKLAVGFGDTATRAVVEISDDGGGFDLAFGVVGVPGPARLCSLITAIGAKN